MAQQRVIGMIGGMSWESTAEYYRLANVLVAERLVADPVAAGVDVEFLHIGDVTAAAVRKAKLSRIGLLGTAFTTEQPFLRDRLAAHGLTVLVPDADDRALVHRVIDDELCRGIVRDGSRAAFREVLARFADAGAEGEVLGGTEIELLVGPADATVPLFPTTRLHVEAAVDRALTHP